MFVGNEDRLNAILESIAESLDISPSDYERAVDSYQSVGKWLEDGFAEAYPGSRAKPAIYPQGSIRLGTVVRPIKHGAEADYDVDLVCELQVSNVAYSPGNAMAVKQQVGGRLKANKIYADKLAPEGRRCWTLDYIRDDGNGFHIDVLPCIPAETSASLYADTAISVTHKDKAANTYEWKPSNPKGYATWFEGQNITFAELMPQQKQVILEKAVNFQTRQALYKSIDQVPDQLVRTPLQRAIQILKRHRDMRFATEDRNKIKPISIIITTLAASLYQGEGTLYYTLKNILSKLSMYAELQDNPFITLHESIAGLNLIRRKANGEWVIENPANPGENFADRWQKDNDARAHAFFQWVGLVQADLARVLEGGDIGRIQAVLAPSFGEGVVRKALNAHDEQISNKAIIKSVEHLPARFNVPHRQKPQWPVTATSNYVWITGIASRNGYRPWQFKSDSTPLSKHCSLRFEAKTNVSWPYKVYWQVVNTGTEAKSVNGLRGGFYDGIIEQGGRVREESTLYSGMHWIECFIIKHGTCIARSGEFVVNIE